MTNAPQDAPQDVGDPADALQRPVGGAVPGVSADSAPAADPPAAAGAAAPVAEARLAIRRLALPMAAGEIVGYVQILALMALVGRMGGNALYIRSLYGPLSLVFVAMGISLGVTAQVATAISRGRDRPGDVVPIAVSIIRVWIVVGIGLTILLSLAAPAVASLFDVRAAARQEFVWFLRWMSVVSLLSFGTVVPASVLRGYGHARQGLLLGLGSAVSEVGLVVVLNRGTGLGVGSLPIAAASSSVVGLVIGARLLRRVGLWRAGPRTSWQPEVLGHIRSIGVPVALTFVVLAGYNMALLWILGPQGATTVSGLSVALSVQGLVIMPALVVGAAGAIVMNQARGAGTGRRIPLTYRAQIQLVAAVYLVLGPVTWLARDFLTGLLTNDPAVAHEAARYLGFVALTYVIQGPVLASLTVLEQIGAGTRAVILNVVYFGEIILVGRLVFGMNHHPSGLYVTIAAANIVGVVVVFVTGSTLRRLSRAEA